MCVLKVDVLPGKFEAPTLKHCACAQKLSGHGPSTDGFRTGRIWDFLIVIPLVFAGTVLKTH